MPTTGFCATRLPTNLTTPAPGALVCRNRHALISPVRDTSIRTLSCDESRASLETPLLSLYAAISLRR